ncbi:Cof-type HAD-IIB family hydrolase [Loigolactobacillus zhaoyuanensis]|uniref:Cof-type HAD-IIB family hydrolase n=1 Tax=Loigolactobacillus zhaoyuanensis TaxID=2486017 RepID=A0ABW8UDH2_9LACO|nr:Cof-type HAD-IIB family hydrolase [Loigolactobacillus zhaoyuanensis]
MTIKLIATDIDGTFLNDQHEYAIDRFNEWLQEMQRRGIHFAIASGNHYGHLTDIFATRSPIKTFMAENGALIMDQQTIVAETQLPQQTVQQLLRTLNDDPALKPDSIRLSGQQSSYMNRTDPDVNDAELRYYISNLQTVADIAQVTDHIYKVNVAWKHEDIKQKADYLNAKFPGAFHATASGFGSLDVIPAGINKGVGLQQLEDHWQLSPAEVAAFGDNYNDLEMLGRAKYGYAMLNAAPAIQQQAAFVTRLDNNHFGVLDTIEQLLKRD